MLIYPPPILARPHFLVGGRSGSKELHRGSLARRACHRLAEPFQAGRDGAPEGRACGPTVSAASKLCRSQGEPRPAVALPPLSSGVGSGAAASTVLSLDPLSFETPPMTRPRSLRAHPPPFTRSSAPPHKLCGACDGSPRRPARAAQRCTVARAMHMCSPAPHVPGLLPEPLIDPCATTLHAHRRSKLDTCHRACPPDHARQPVHANPAAHQHGPPVRSAVPPLPARRR